jgi:hypothetical protein
MRKPRLVKPGLVAGASGSSEALRIHDSGKGVGQTTPNRLERLLEALTACFRRDLPRFP